MEFAVLTVLISVQVNDSAPSMGTHYRVWMGEIGEGSAKREREMEPVNLGTK